MTAIYRATLAAPSPPGRSQARPCLCTRAVRSAAVTRNLAAARHESVGPQRFDRIKQKRRGEAPETLRPRQHERRF